MELEVTAIKYVGPATVKRLAEHGISTVEQLAAMPVEALTVLPGIGEHTAPLIIANAQEVLAAPAITPPNPEVEAEVEIVDVPEAIVEMDVETVETAPESELSKKELKKQAKRAKKLKKAQKVAKKAEKKAAKKAEKKREKQLKAEQKAVEKAEKKAAKQAKKAEKKAAS
ncbi:MAG: helix-hairpin-helix domain-containing protein [Candidatus Thiothrix putei]|uniref:Helix-hairpin-helix domain-containing protein n=1 Tax=Candidatus Thiothrix putei TaxID=3080811 RepID=A0AA95HKM1_9GAMM|nr:MAG: helix-hairpin-helix domain-containing protein [Candidatus Thiothrix putei]